MSKNMALAHTIPDTGRDSHITIRATNHPISDALERLASAVVDSGCDLLDALAVDDIEAIRRVPGQQRMLAARLRVLASEARAVEALVREMQEVAR